MALYGYDVSSYQSVGTGQDGDFLIIKATEGTGYVDPLCDAHYQLAKRNGKLLGVYHFARPDLCNAVDEARFFYENCKNYFHEAIPVLDWEQPGTMWNVAWAKQWLDTVYQLSGVRPMIYMSASVVSGYDWRPVVEGNYGLWIAGYPAKYDVWNPPRPAEDELPYSVGAWPFAAIWQYSSSAGSLDRDIAYLDRNAWYAYAGKAVEQPKPTSQPEQPKEEPKQDPVENPEPTVPDLPIPENQGNEGKKTDKNNKKEPEQPESTDKGLTVEEYNKIIENAQKSIELIGGVANQYGFKINMPSKLYDALKVIAIAVLPAISFLYVGLANIWGFGFGAQVDATIQLLITAINTVLGLTLIKSSKDYHGKEDS